MAEKSASLLWLAPELALLRGPASRAATASGDPTTLSSVSDSAVSAPSSSSSSSLCAEPLPPAPWALPASDKNMSPSEAAELVEASRARPARPAMSSTPSSSPSPPSSPSLCMGPKPPASAHSPRKHGHMNSFSMAGSLRSRVSVTPCGGWESSSAMPPIVMVVPTKKKNCGVERRQA